METIKGLINLSIFFGRRGREYGREKYGTSPRHLYCSHYIPLQLNETLYPGLKWNARVFPLRRSPKKQLTYFLYPLLYSLCLFLPPILRIHLKGLIFPSLKWILFFLDPGNVKKLESTIVCLLREPRVQSES